MSTPDLSQLLERAREVQTRVEALRRELAARTVEASAGGGMVTVVVSGDLRVREIRLEPSLVREGDGAMIANLTAAALNEALARAQQMVQEEFQRAAGGLQVQIPLGPRPGEPSS